jgi:hypothetical protein
MERRSSKRIVVQMAAEVEISETCGMMGSGTGGKSFKGVVETVDLSLCGLSARIISSPLDTDRTFSPALAHLLVGKEIRAAFCSSGLTVWGKVVRFDPRNMLMAVIITRVSDIMHWRELCSDAIFSTATR